MAKPALRLKQNAAGPFYVDESCIDCGVCRFVAPASFSAEGSDQSYVHRQPEGAAERHRAAMAIVACSTHSIGCEEALDLHPAIDAFPDPIAEDLWFTGFAAESSYGASSWLLRTDHGNVLIDSPRASRPLMKRIEALGGVRWMFLTHKDDVADHAAYQRRFGCTRILHRADLSSDTKDVELVLEGQDPIELAPRLLAIPVPGHTRGSTALLYRDRYLFTGDHLWRSASAGRLHASQSVCWYSWPEQLRSMERLLDHRFTWILPGHGHMWRAPSHEAMREQLIGVISRMRS